MFVLSPSKGTDLRGYGQLDTPSITASVAGASGVASDSASLLPYYLVAVAAGVTVYLITRMLGRRG